MMMWLFIVLHAKVPPKTNNNVESFRFINQRPSNAVIAHIQQEFRQLWSSTSKLCILKGTSRTMNVLSVDSDRPQVETAENTSGDFTWINNLIQNLLVPWVTTSCYPIATLKFLQSRNQSYWSLYFFIHDRNVFMGISNIINIII